MISKLFGDANQEKSFLKMFLSKIKLFVVSVRIIENSSRVHGFDVAYILLTFITIKIFEYVISKVLSVCVIKTHFIAMMFIHCFYSECDVRPMKHDDESIYCPIYRVLDYKNYELF